MKISTRIISAVVATAVVSVGASAFAAELVDANGQVLGTVIDSGSVLRTEGGVSFTLTLDSSDSFNWQQGIPGLVHEAADCSDTPQVPMSKRMFRFSALVFAGNGVPISEQIPPQDALGYYPAPPYQPMTLRAVEIPRYASGLCNFGGQPISNSRCCVNSGGVPSGIAENFGDTITAGAAASFDLSQFVAPFSVR